MDQPSTKQNTITPPAKGGKPKRRRRGLFNLVLFIGIITAIALFGWAEMQRRSAITKLEETEQELQRIRESTERRGEEVAQEVLSKVRALIEVPAEPEPTVATIIDIDALRQSNEFYNKAENGDHLIITENRAILFDPDRGIILDVVPVSINREQQEQIPQGDDAGQGAGTAQPQQPAAGQPEASPAADQVQPGQPGAAQP